MSKKLEGQVAVVTGRPKASVRRLPSTWRQPVQRSWSITPAAGPGRRGSSSVSGKRAGKPLPCRPMCPSSTMFGVCLPRRRRRSASSDILVNNAGIYEFAPLETISAGALSQAI